MVDQKEMPRPPTIRKTGRRRWKNARANRRDPLFGKPLDRALGEIGRQHVHRPEYDDEFILRFGDTAGVDGSATKRFFVTDDSDAEPLGDLEGSVRGSVIDHHDILDLEGLAEHGLDGCLDVPGIIAAGNIAAEFHAKLLAGTEAGGPRMRHRE